MKDHEEQNTRRMLLKLAHPISWLNKKYTLDANSPH